MRTRGLLLSLGWAVAIARESTVVRAQGGAPSHEELARAAVQRVLGRGAPQTRSAFGAPRAREGLSCRRVTLQHFKMMN